RGAGRHRRRRTAARAAERPDPRAGPRTTGAPAGTAHPGGGAPAAPGGGPVRRALRDRGRRERRRPAHGAARGDGDRHSLRRRIRHRRRRGDPRRAHRLAGPHRGPRRTARGRAGGARPGHRPARPHRRRPRAGRRAVRLPRAGPPPPRPRRALRAPQHPHPAARGAARGAPGRARPRRTAVTPGLPVRAGARRPRRKEPVMRIAYALLDPGIGVFGTKGASVHVQEVIRALRAEGHHVTVFCTRTDEAVPADLADLEVRRHRLPRGTGAEREQAVAAASAAIAEEIAAGGYDLVYERYSLFSDTAARLSAPTAPNAVPIPSILEVNAPLIAEQRRHRSLADEAGARAATERQLRGANLISCVSEPVAQWTRQE